jgi:hypothetical protein
MQKMSNRNVTLCFQQEKVLCNHNTMVRSNGCSPDNHILQGLRNSNMRLRRLTTYRFRAPCAASSSSWHHAGGSSLVKVISMSSFLCAAPSFSRCATRTSVITKRSCSCSGMKGAVYSPLELFYLRLLLWFGSFATAAHPRPACLEVERKNAHMIQYANGS